MSENNNTSKYIVVHQHNRSILSIRNNDGSTYILYTVDIFPKYIKLHHGLSAYTTGRHGRHPK